ncbi:MAG: hypothetical protein COX20_09245 [Desulfobacterales bacterium CG23_combo_of_CG06-09_8_20_14_all_52_9]|nr:MAG: hypothetical protein COX20_09245 [Desulfobacterales bacterium CG23_combo_of_CG06-09_8_20_14_all_52_9]
MRQNPFPAIDILRRLPAPLFTSSDAAKLIANENTFLYRASKKGHVKKIANRIYWNVLFSADPPTVEAVACFARKPSYVSCEWALNYHGILLQTPRVCTAVTLHPGIGKRNRIHYEGFVIEYSGIAEKLYLPEEILNLEYFLMATPEKALLDTVYLRKHLPFADELETGMLDKTRLVKAAARYPERVRKAISL